MWQCWLNRKYIFVSKAEMVIPSYIYSSPFWACLFVRSYVCLFFTIWHCTEQLSRRNLNQSYSVTITYEDRCKQELFSLPPVLRMNRDSGLDLQKQQKKQRQNMTHQTRVLSGESAWKSRLHGTLGFHDSSFIHILEARMKRMIPVLRGSRGYSSAFFGIPYLVWRG